MLPLYFTKLCFSRGKPACLASPGPLAEVALPARGEEQAGDAAVGTPWVRGAEPGTCTRPLPNFPFSLDGWRREAALEFLVGKQGAGGLKLLKTLRICSLSRGIRNGLGGGRGFCLSWICFLCVSGAALAPEELLGKGLQAQPCCGLGSVLLGEPWSRDCLANPRVSALMHFLKGGLCPWEQMSWIVLWECGISFFFLCQLLKNNNKKTTSSSCLPPLWSMVTFILLVTTSGER